MLISDETIQFVKFTKQVHIEHGPTIPKGAVMEAEPQEDNRTPVIARVKSSAVQDAGKTRIRIYKR